MWSECIPALASLTSIVKREPVWNVLDLQEAAPQDSHKHLSACMGSLVGGLGRTLRDGARPAASGSSQPPASDATGQAQCPALHREEAGCSEL